jgi:putative hydrolase of the HAD superfamily
LFNAVLLDFGDTIVSLKDKFKANIEELRAQNIVEYLRGRGLRVEKEYFREHFTKISEQMNRFCERYSIELTIDKVVAETLRKMDFIVEPDIIKGVERAAYEFLLDLCVLPDDALVAFDRLRGAGFKMAVVSNTRSDWFLREALKKLKILSYFDYISTSANLGVRKPRPEPFLKALSKVGFDSRETVMIGDQYRTDMLGALMLGMKTIQIIREIPNHDNLDFKPTSYARSLNEAADMAINLNC